MSVGIHYTYCHVPYLMTCNSLHKRQHCSQAILGVTLIIHIMKEICFEDIDFLVWHWEHDEEK